MKRALRCISLSCITLFGGCADPAAWTAPVSGLDKLVLSVWGDAPDQLYLAGGSLGGPGGPSGALAMRFTGSEWKDLSPPTTVTLWWVYSRGAGKPIWFVGEQGTILRLDGETFTAMPSGTTQTLYGIWGASDDDLWAVGGLPDRSSVALHWDGASWSPVAGIAAGTGAYFKVWGTSASDVFVVGQYAGLMHYDGQAWTKMSIAAGAISPLASLLTVAGSTPSDVYAVGGVGTGVALHYDGATWTPVAGLDAASTPGLTGVSVSADGDVSITGLAGTKLRGRNGGPWIDDSRRAPLLDLHATRIFGKEDVFAVGGNLNAPAGSPREGVIAHYGAALPRK